MNKSKTEFISAIINILSHYERIKNQRILSDFGNILSYYLCYPVKYQSKDSIKAHFISFYYKRRQKEIKKERKILEKAAKKNPHQEGFDF